MATAPRARIQAPPSSPASSCTSTSKSSAASWSPATASLGIKRGMPLKARNGGGRGIAGWEFVHVMVDDHSRLAYVEVPADERGPSAVAFLRRASAWFGGHGITIKRVMSDNGSCYRWRGFQAACRELGMRHIRTRPYRPRTNGKAERFIQTLLREWAYVRIYGTSAERTAALAMFVERYNFKRPHSSLGHKPPGSRLNNLVGNHYRRRTSIARRRRECRGSRAHAAPNRRASPGKRTRIRSSRVRCRLVSGTSGIRTPCAGSTASSCNIVRGVSRS